MLQPDPNHITSLAFLSSNIDEYSRTDVTSLHGFCVPLYTDELVFYRDRVVEVPYEKVVYQDKVNVEYQDVEQVTALTILNVFMFDLASTFPDQ